MKQEVVDLILYNSDPFELEEREEYSGRGMFGETTTGITAPSISEFFAGALSAVENLIDEGSLDEAKEICQGCKNIRTDNLGYDKIIY